jgi:predicted patatin/cPLA2 family phospholipase
MLARRLADDVLSAPAGPAGEDLRGHPVVELLCRRRDEGSRPGERRDGRRVALVIEGGAMRGAVSAGMAAAIEQLGLLDSFDEVHGASAGAFNAAFLLAGQAAYLTGLYQYGFGDPRFASPWRVLRGGPPLDMDYLIGEVWTRRRPLDFDAILQGEIALHCTATDADRAELVDLTDLASAEEIRCALRASGRLPWLAGPPVHFRGRRLLDATLIEAIPVSSALSHASDILVLQTRPVGVAHAPLSWPVGALTDRYLRTINPALVQLRRTRSERYDRLSERLLRMAADTEATPALCVIRPPAGTPVIGQLEHRTAALQRAASDGLRAAWMALTGEDPEPVCTLRAYPRRSARTDRARAARPAGRR